MNVAGTGNNAMTLAPSGRVIAQSTSHPFRQGMIAGVLCIVLGFSTTVFATHDSLVRMVGLIILPLVAGLLLTRNLQHAITLIWANELFAGGAGDWIFAGPISGRWLLLLTTLGFYMLTRILARPHFMRNKTSINSNISAWIAFLGLIFPVWLVSYAVLVKGVPVSRALADVDFLIVLLMYFPMISLGANSRYVFLGWIVAGSSVFVCLFFFMAFYRPEFAEAVFLALSPGSVFGITSGGINRAVQVPIVFLPFMAFICVLYIIDDSTELKQKSAAFFLCFASLLPILAMWVRGPLVAFALVLFILILAMAWSGRSISGFFRLGALTLLLIVGGIWVMSLLVPEQFRARFLGAESGLVEAWLERDRVEQAEILLDALKLEPYFGQGVGAPIPGYTRAGEDTLSMELEYNKLLYRFGIVAFAIFMFPVAWLFLEPFRIFRNKRVILSDMEAKFMLATLASVLAILIMGATNPFLTTPYTGLMVLLYLRLKLAHQQKY